MMNPKSLAKFLPVVLISTIAVSSTLPVAEAAPITQDIALTPLTSGFPTTSPIFGLTALPTGPFTLTLGLESTELTPSLTGQPATLNSFALTIGTATWSASNFSFVTVPFNISTDAAAQLTGFNLGFFSLIAPLSGLDFNASTSSWLAQDFTGPNCVTTSGPQGEFVAQSGACIAGGYQVVTAGPGPGPTPTPDEISEPGTGLLLLGSLAGLSAIRRRKP